MAKQGRLLIAGLTAFAVGVSGSPALADSLAPPESYKEVAPGGKYVFVMIAPHTVEEETRPWNEETAAGIREIRRVYTRSGMYRNDGSADPLWTVDWYSHGVDLTPDGVHLIRPGPGGAWLRHDKMPDLDVEAVSFFANGRLLQTYRVGELVDAPSRFERSVSHYRWQQDGRVSGESEYTITTLDGNRFVFDVRTGKIVSESRMGWVSRWGWQAALGAAAVAVAAWLIWRWSRRRRTEAEPKVAPDCGGIT
jgi:hypothetical protein